MKKTIILFATACLVMTSCNYRQAEIDRQNEIIDSLKTVNEVKDNSMMLLAETMSDLQTNINTIKEKEGIINMQLSEGSDQEQIQSDLDAISKALEDNKKKVANLQSQLSKATKNNKELESIISALNAQIEQQNQEIAKLRNTLVEKDIEISFLNNAVIRLSSSVDSLASRKTEIDEQLASAKDQLTTGYYVVNTKSYLKEHDLINTGLFSGKHVTGNYDEKLFTRVNINDFTTLHIDGRKAELISSQPASSYKIEKTSDGLQLVILNKKAFWSGSKYVVILKR